MKLSFQDRIILLRMTCELGTRELRRRLGCTRPTIQAAAKGDELDQATGEAIRLALRQWDNEGGSDGQPT